MGVMGLFSAFTPIVSLSWPVRIAGFMPRRTFTAFDGCASARTISSAGISPATLFGPLLWHWVSLFPPWQIGGTVFGHGLVICRCRPAATVAEQNHFTQTTRILEITYSGSDILCDYFPINLRLVVVKP